MEVARRCDTQRLLHRHLRRGGGQQIPAADHIRDAHVRIVDHHRQMVGKQAIATADDEIADLVGQVDGLGATGSILEA